MAKKAETQNQVIDQSDLKKYRTEIPNIIDDLGLTPFDIRLYFRLKRLAGAKGGECFATTKELAEHCGFSSGQISKSKQSLASSGLIELSKKPGKGGLLDVIIILDIWERNFTYYIEQKRSYGERKPDDQGNESVHQVNAKDKERSPGERKSQQESKSVHTVNANEEMRSPGERWRSPGERKLIQTAEKNQPEVAEIKDLTAKKGSRARASGKELYKELSEKEQEEGREVAGNQKLAESAAKNPPSDPKPETGKGSALNGNPNRNGTNPTLIKKPLPTDPDFDPVVDAVISLCGIDMGKYGSDRFCREIEPLIRDRVTVEQINQFEEWWYRVDWRGKKDELPTIALVKDLWGKAFKEPRQKNSNEPKKNSTLDWVAEAMQEKERDQAKQ